MSDEQYDEPNHEAELDASDEAYDFENEFDFDAEELDSEEEPASESEEEFEEITSDEVDRVIEALEKLVENVESENIRAHLENAVNEIFYLVYNDEDLEIDEDDLEADAA